MKNVLITGASRGIGRAIAIKFASSDCNLFVNSLHPDRLSESAAELTAIRREAGSVGTILAIPGDVGNPDFVRDMFAQLFRSNGRGADILVNNAGISYVGLLQDMSDEDWNRIIATNLSSVHYCCHEAVPGMIKNAGGRIINISSVWGNTGASCEVAYSATKGGVNAYTRALARELAPSGISVNAVACGCVDTDMNRCFGEDERAALCNEIPAGRFADPEEVAQLVYSLTEQSPYLTGQIITLDGGWT